MRNRFTNPLNGATYDWPINHASEEEFGYDLNIEHSGNTGNVGLVRQEGDPSPIVLRYSGTLLTRAQFEAMWGWVKLCRSQPGSPPQTIHFRDFDNQQYEVLITEFKPTRQRTLKNPRGGTDTPHHYWTYTISMEVIRTISGDLHDAGVVV